MFHCNKYHSNKHLKLKETQICPGEEKFITEFVSNFACRTFPSSPAHTNDYHVV